MKQKVVVFSDVAGHMKELEAKLNKIGGSAYDCHIPKDTIVIMNGDMIHRGPESEAVMVFCQKAKNKFDKRFFVNVGNHEGNYISQNPHKFYWHDACNEKTSSIVQKMWNEKTMSIGVGLETEFGDMLVVHGGITKHFWNLAGEPDNVVEMCKSLRHMRNTNTIWSTGVMAGNNTNVNVGPVWASISDEVVPSWIDFVKFVPKTIPFGQVVGHSTMFDYDRIKYRTSNSDIMNGTVVNTRDRISVTTIHETRFVCTDPCHDTVPARSWEPFVMENARVKYFG